MFDGQFFPGQAMQFEGGPPRPPWYKRSGQYIAEKTGLSSSLQLCLDAGENASLPAASTQWLDLSGNGYDFDFGAATAAPTINGTPGDLLKGTYLGFDGGDYLTYDSANEAWMNGLHKDSAVFWAACWIYPAGATANNIIGNNQGSTSAHGIDWHVNTSTTRNFLRIANGTGTAAFNSNLLSSFVDGSWQFAAIAVDEAAGTGFMCRNAGYQSITPTYSSPSASDASFTLQVGARGNNSGPLPNGARLGMLLMGTGSIPSQDAFTAFYRASRCRFEA